MNGIGGRLGGFINPYLQTNQRKATTQKQAAEEEPKLKDVKPQGNESTQPSRNETVHYYRDKDGKAHIISYIDDQYGEALEVCHNSDGTADVYYTNADGRTGKHAKYENGNPNPTSVEEF